MLTPNVLICFSGRYRAVRNRLTLYDDHSGMVVEGRRSELGERGRGRFREMSNEKIMKWNRVAMELCGDQRGS